MAPDDEGMGSAASAQGERSPLTVRKHLGKVLLRAVLMAAAIGFYLLLRAAGHLALAGDLNWFDGTAAFPCAEDKPDCPALLTMVERFYAWLPVAIVAVLAVALWLRERTSEVGRAGSLLYAGALLLGAFSTLIVWTQTADPLLGLGWALGALLLAIAALAVRLLWLEDPSPERHSRSGHLGLARFREAIKRQRASLVVLLLYLVLFLVAAQTSGQALDALRSWGFGDAADLTPSVLGLVTTLLLALAVRETGVELEQLPGQPGHDFRRWLWILAGAVVATIGAALWWGPFSAGVFALGVGLGIMGLLGFVPERLLSREESPREVVRERELDADAPGIVLGPRLSTFGQWLVALPFVVLGAGLAVASLDRYWITDDLRRSWYPIALTLCSLVLGAVVSVDHYGFRGRGGPTSQRVEAWLAPEQSRTPQTSMDPRDWPRPWWRGIWRWLRRWWQRIVVWLAPGIVVLVPVATLTRRDPGLTLAIVVFLLAVVIAYACLVASGSRWGLLQLSLPGALWAAVAAAVGLHVDPLTTSRVFGADTLVNLASAALVVFGYLVVRMTTSNKPPPVLAWLGLRSLPVLTPLLVWWLVIGVALPDRLHDVEVVDRSAPAAAAARTEAAPPDLRSAFTAWAAAQPELVETLPGAPEQPGAKVVPMMLVASHGGGIRAAYWTALVLDCLTAASGPETERSWVRLVRSVGPVCGGVARTGAEVQAAARRVFLASGVSGGSVGLAAYAHHLLQGDLSTRDWMDTKLGADYASPAVGWGLFHDLPNHVLGLAPSSGACGSWWIFECAARDRAAILEAALDRDTPAGEAPQLRRTWDERTAEELGVRSRAQTVPLLLFNSTQVGGRFTVVASAAKLGSQKLDIRPNTSRDVRPTATDEPLPLGGHQETIDLLCSDKDLKLSTASVLSARFPLVSPSGRLTGKCGKSPAGQRFQYKACDDDTCAMNMVDGGYFDNSGMLTLTGLWPQLRRLVVEYNARHSPDIAPFFVDIDNSYQARDRTRTNPASVPESLVPFSTARVSTAVERYARGRLYGSFPRQCAMTLAPAVQPVLMAPLGWSLSPTTRTELRAALDDPQRDGDGKALGRRGNLAKLQRWLGSEPLSAEDRRKLGTCVPVS